MSERVLPGPVQDGACIKEAVCIHTKKIYDSCKDKDCIEDIRLYLTPQSQQCIENAVSLRAKSARLLHVSIDVEEMTFNRGFYTVDVRYFYKIKGDAFYLMSKPTEICGLAVFDKRVVLFGSEGAARIFTSKTVLGANDLPEFEKNNLPLAVVEAVDPVILNMKLVDHCHEGPPICDCDAIEVPVCIAECFDNDIIMDNRGRKVYVTLGQFSIIRLERDSQLLIPAYDYCMPEKECTDTNDDDPCTLFSKICFPVDEFFPPNSVSCPECYCQAKKVFNT